MTHCNRTNDAPRPDGLRRRPPRVVSLERRRTSSMDGSALEDCKQEPWPFLRSVGRADIGRCAQVHREPSTLDAGRPYPGHRGRKEAVSRLTRSAGSRESRGVRRFGDYPQPLAPTVARYSATVVLWFSLARSRGVVSIGGLSVHVGSVSSPSGDVDDCAITTVRNAVQDRWTTTPLPV